ncbi:helix-turn-helix domain-containing protein [Nocardia higoensis]|uniref:Helix-turn-helix domain-containing protein n=1 Tax=Nocardia higoensis TaxID=228599 RepID=A0ABS0D8X3_9NOCA|nr:helix-turn-helix domain-containing protein [Nocardia higoensis]MBF6354922.1 helix-turn-helix domain-containing protein [Nocardia higoensis]
MIVVTKWTGLEVRALRREALRISQRELAEMTGFSEAAVGKWERRGETITLTGEFAAGMDTALSRLDGEQLARFQAQLTDLAQRDASAHGSKNRPIIGTEGTGQLPVPDAATEEAEDEVNRNEFLRGLVAVSAAAVADGLEVVGSTPIEPPVPRRVGMDHVAQIRAWAGLFRAADDAGLRIGEAMAAQLRTAVGYLDADMPTHVRTAMQSAVGTFFRVAGWAYYDRGQHGPARAYFQAGWRLADDVGEWWLRAAILTCMARQAIYLDKADDALTMLGVASVRSDRISLLRRADIAAVQARAFGRLGNDVECVRSIRQAEQLFSEAADQDHADTEHEGFGTYYNEQLLNSDAAHGLFDLAYERNIEVDSSIDRLRGALQLSDEHARSRQIGLTRLAALQLRHGDLDEGVALGQKAVEDASGTTSMRVLDEFKRVYQATGESRIKNATGVLELRRNIADLFETV